MTSVRNHLRQLSGNKTYIIAILLALTLQSCKLFEGNKRTPPPPPPPPVEETKPDEVPEETPDIPDVAIDTVKKPKPVLKEEINIGVVLPFNLEQLESTNSFNAASRNSFQLYKGLKQAAYDFNIDDDYEIVVKVLDNKKLASTTKRVIEGAGDLDLIVGPLYTENIQALDAFAKENQIPIISPLSSSTALANNNEYIFSAVATKQSRYDYLLNYISDNFDNPNIGIMFQPLPREQSAKDGFVRMAQSKGISVREQLSEGAEMFSSVTNLLERGRSNIVVVPAAGNDEGQLYIDRLLSYLEYESANFDITVIGLEEWNGFTNIAPSKFGLVNTLILDRYHVNQYDAVANNKLNDLRLSNGGRPLSDYMIQGYDIMDFVGSLINQYGTEFNQHLSEKAFRGLQTTIQFGSFEENGRMKFQENKFINILQYNNGSWELVNR